MERLYDLRTVEIIRAKAARSRRLVLLITTIICGALVVPTHDEYPFLAYWLGACSSAAGYAYECSLRTSNGGVAGAVTIILMVLRLIVFQRVVRMQPTISCRRCGPSGWVLDREP